MRLTARSKQEFLSSKERLFNSLFYANQVKLLCKSSLSTLKLLSMYLGFGMVLHMLNPSQTFPGIRKIQQRKIMLRDPQKFLNLITCLRILQTGFETEGQKYLCHMIYIFSVRQKCSKENAFCSNDLLDFIQTLTHCNQKSFHIFFSIQTSLHLAQISSNAAIYQHKSDLLKKSFYTLEVFKIGIETHICVGGTVLMYESLLLEIHLGTDS